MENFEISTAEFLTVLTAMETAADTYQAESNRSQLADVRRLLRKRVERTRVIAQSLKNRALADSEFADAYRNAGSR